MYGVFENNRPCSVKGFPTIHPSWDNHKFYTFEEAVEYANKWLGIYGPKEFKLNVEVSACGSTDYITIKDCEEESLTAAQEVIRLRKVLMDFSQLVDTDAYVTQTAKKELERSYKLFPSESKHGI